MVAAFQLRVFAGAMFAGAAMGPLLRAQAFQSEPCPTEVAFTRCGTLAVPENRAAPTGRQLTLWVAIRSATASSRKPDPLLVILGGPGDAASSAFPAALMSHASADSTRDVIMYDARGVGRSSPLSCVYGSDEDPQSYLREFLPVAAMRECLRGLQATHALARYGAGEVVGDLEQLREALGVRQFNLHATSYGTRVALRYLSLHPKSIRSAVLVSVMSPALMVPASFGRDGDLSLEFAIQDCADSAACAAAFPHLRDELAGVMKRLDAGPVSARVAFPGRPDTVTVSLSRALFGESVRAILYSPDHTAGLPRLIHLAATGDYSGFASFALTRQRGFARGGGLGAYAAITCYEDIPRIDSSRGIADNRGTLIGHYRFEQLLALCPAGSPSPVQPMTRSSTPVLILSGVRDPVTPPRWARELLPLMSGARMIEITHGRHNFVGLANARCLRLMSARFTDNPSSFAPDSACISGAMAPPFIAAVARTEPMAAR
jgi:pimeloyl-ACP methyl ester carboxylesterase